VNKNSGPRHGRVLECSKLKYIDERGVLFDDLSLTLDYGQGGLILSEPRRRSLVLFRIFATLQRPSSGYLNVFGLDANRMSDRNLTFARRRIGLVHRAGRLVSNMSLMDNVCLGYLYHDNMPKAKAYEQVQDLMEGFGLHVYRNLRPDEVSFEKRRLALYIREMAKHPSLMLLEAPSLDLDRSFGLVMNELKRMAQQGRTSFIISDLEPREASNWVDWVLVMDDQEKDIYPIDLFDPEMHRQFAGRSELGDTLTRVQRT
jgi:putative ABC transport system ATP-binding protein